MKNILLLAKAFGLLLTALNDKGAISDEEASKIMDVLEKIE